MLKLYQLDINMHIFYLIHTLTNYHLFIFIIQFNIDIFHANLNWQPFWTIHNYIY